MTFNGRVVATAAIGSGVSINFNSSMQLGIGGLIGVGGPQGNVQYFRMTKGVARYTGPHVPPVDGAFNTFGNNVVTSSIGTYTRQVTNAGEPNPDALIASVDAAIVDLGWSAYDTVYNVGQVQKVYRCLNKDGVTYKYVVIFWDKTIQSFHMTSCESWDLTNQVMTNECYIGNRALRHGYSTFGTDVVIFGSSRHLGIMSFVQNSPSNWQMCVELEREAAEDTAAAGFPTWGMTNGASWVNQVAGWANNDWISLPRTRDGRSGPATATLQNQQMQFAHGTYGLQYTSKFADDIRTSNAVWGPLKHAWDSGKRLVSSPKLITVDTASLGLVSIHGRTFGLKAVPNVGNLMDKVNLPVDSDLFYAAGGTGQDHWVLPINYDAASSCAVQGSWQPTTNSYAQTQVAYAMAFTGVAVYHATASGVYKTDFSSGNTTAVSGPTGVVTDICFDGQYVYAATTAGVSRIDTLNGDAHTSLTIGTGGIQALCWDGHNRLFASQRTASNGGGIYAIDTGSFTQWGTTTTLSGKTSTSTVMGLACDGQDTVLGMFGNTTTAADMGLVGITMSTNAAAWITSPVTALAVYTYGCTWHGQYFSMAYATSNTTSGGTVGAHLITNAGALFKNTISVTAGNESHTNGLAKCVTMRTPNHMGVFVPSTFAGQSFSTGDGGGAGAVGTATAGSTKGIGGYTNTAVGVRCGMHTGNQYLFHTTDGNFYHVAKQYYHGGNNTYGHGQMLIPR